MWTPAHRHLVRGLSTTLENKTKRMDKLGSKTFFVNTFQFLLIFLILNYPRSFVHCILFGVIDAYKSI